MKEDITFNQGVMGLNDAPAQSEFTGTVEFGNWIQGEDGKDGLTPYIGENGNWWIGDTDTGVLAGESKIDRVLVNGVSVVQNKIANILVPVKVSELTNDANYQTQNEVNSTASDSVHAHNTADTSHVDIRTAISEGASAQKKYTDSKISELIGTAPEMLDTLEEIAKAIQEGGAATEALNQAIATKLGKTDAESLYVALQGYVAYTQTEKNKLQGLNNYNDSAIKNTIALLDGSIEARAKDVIDNKFKEVTAYEYANLPDSKLTDGNYYTIVD